MKRLFSVLMFIVLLLSNTSYAEIDYTSKTDEELMLIIQDAQAELDRRNSAEEDPDGFYASRILFDEKGIKMYLTGNYQVKDYYGKMHLYIEVIVENNSKQDAGCMGSNFSVNGWTGTWDAPSPPPPGNKKKGNLSFDMASADVTTFEEISEVEFGLNVYETNQYKTLFDTPRIKIKFKH